MKIIFSFGEISNFQHMICIKNIFMIIDPDIPIRIKLGLTLIPLITTSVFVFEVEFSIIMFSASSKSTE